MSDENESVNDVPDSLPTKREVKLTGKALMGKIERLQKERNTHVNKIKKLIPATKELMKRNENAQQVNFRLQALLQHYDSALKLHEALLPLLPDDQQAIQNDWFSSIIKYSDTFKGSVTQWLNEIEGPLGETNSVSIENDQTIKTVENDCAVNIENNCANVPDFGMKASSQEMAQCIMLENVCHPQLSAKDLAIQGDLQDAVQPADSISNAPSTTSTYSSVSSIYSACIKAEADLAALMARQNLMRDKHALEEEEERIRKRKEKLKLDEDIAAHMAKVSVLRSASLTGARSTATEQSNGMNSYFSQAQGNSKKFNANAAPFIPQSTEPPKRIVLDTGGDPVTRPKVRMATHTQIQHFTSEDRARKPNLHFNANHSQHRKTIKGPSIHNEQSNVFDVMKKQNEITTLLMQQQQLSSLPKRDIQVFEGDPLHYHSFMRAFESGVESKSNNCSDCLYFLEQYTRGHPRALVRSCLHVEPEEGYVQAKALLRKHFGNEQRIAAAYMEKALSWTPIKSDDVKILQDYSLFLRGCCNMMNDVQYMYELDMPANMIAIIKKLPYRLRDRWRTVACELQERHQERATFSDIVDFIEKQVRILTDPVFGNIQDTPPRPIQRPNKSSFATTMNTRDINTETMEYIPERILPTKFCLFCEAEHTLESCHQLKRKTHREKITFLMENGVCFACLCKGHISRDCRKRLSCQVCDLRHPTLLHIPSRGRQTEPETEQELGTAVDKAFVSSGLTGAGDHECKLPIVPVHIKSSKSNKTVITYAFLDQGSTAVFCTENLMHKLNLSGKKTRILLRTMGQEKVVNSYEVTGLEVAGLDGEQFCQLPSTYTQQSMPVNRDNIPRQRDLQRWPHLRHIHLPEIDSRVELLIGTNVPKVLEPLEVVRSVDNGPYAIKTLLGWTVNGPLGGDDGEELGTVTVNRISVLNLDDLWQQQFKMDFPECGQDERPSLSREDQNFMKLVTDSAQLLDGHYQIALPLRNSQERQKWCDKKRNFTVGGHSPHCG